MSRYRKVITGETELPEINGISFLIYPTIEHKMDLLEHIKSAQMFEEIDGKDEDGKNITKRIKGKYFNLTNIAKTCASIIYEGCFEHDENGKRLKPKEGEEETTEKQILALILECDIMSVYLEILIALGIISKDKADELRKGQGEIKKN